jgi:hypothetical protein
MFLSDCTPGHNVVGLDDTQRRCWRKKTVCFCGLMEIATLFGSKMRFYYLQRLYIALYH